VIRVVEFGGVPTEIPDSVIATLRGEMAESDLVEVRIGLKVGDTVELTEGPMRGFQGIVNGVMSGEERVSVLLDFLGRQSLVQVEVSKLISDAAPRVVAAGR
jgi:transcription antitermination factor NusG